MCFHIVAQSFVFLHTEKKHAFFRRAKLPVASAFFGLGPDLGKLLKVYVFLRQGEAGCAELYGQLSSMSFSRLCPSAVTPSHV